MEEARGGCCRPKGMMQGAVLQHLLVATRAGSDNRILDSPNEEGGKMAYKSKSKKPVRTKSVNKKLIIKALTDPKFRRMLVANPSKALGVTRLSAVNKREIQLVVRTVRGIESQISSMADYLLCVTDGPCGIA